MVSPAWRSKLLGLRGGRSATIFCTSRMLSIVTASLVGIAAPTVVRLFFFAIATTGGTEVVSMRAGGVIAGTTLTGVTGSSLITVRLRGVLSVDPLGRPLCFFSAATGNSSFSVICSEFSLHCKEFSEDSKEFSLASCIYSLQLKKSLERQSKTNVGETC